MRLLQAAWVILHTLKKILRWYNNKYGTLKIFFGDVKDFDRAILFSVDCMPEGSSPLSTYKKINANNVVDARNAFAASAVRKAA